MNTSTSALGVADEADAQRADTELVLVVGLAVAGYELMA
jgi:hypothetical protein